MGVSASGKGGTPCRKLPFPGHTSLTNFTCIDMPWMCLQAPLVLDWARRADPARADGISRVTSSPTHGESSSDGVNEVVGDDQSHNGADLFIGVSRVQRKKAFDTARPERCRNGISSRGHLSVPAKTVYLVHSGDVQPVDIFFVYASEPQRRVDAIRGAIERIQDGSEMGCKAADWTDLPVEGKVISCTICEAIRNARCVATDITDLNFNVLFELGFAIGAGRAIWPLVESSEDEENRLYRAFDILTTLGHSRYTNSKSIATKVLKKKPWLRGIYRLQV